MKKIIMLLIFLMIGVVHAGDKDDFQKEHAEVLEQIKLHEQSIQNLKYRLAQLIYAIDHEAKYNCKPKKEK